MLAEGSPDGAGWFLTGTKGTAQRGKNAALWAAYSALRNYAAAAQDGELCVRCDPDWNKGYFRQATALQAFNLHV